MSDREDRKPDVRVVGATVDLDGELADVVAIAPVEAAVHTQDPETFEIMGSIAVKRVAEGTASRQSGEDAYDIMMATAPTWGRGQTIASQALAGVVTPARLETETTRNLSGNSQ